MVVVGGKMNQRVALKKGRKCENIHTKEIGKRTYVEQQMFLILAIMCMLKGTAKKSK